MTKKAQLDYGWIEEGILKIKSGFSNIVFFETEDPVRHEQFIRRIAALEEYGGHQIYQYDRWDGLRLLDGSQGRFADAGMGAGASPDSGLKDAADAFRHVDRKMKNQPVILLIRDMEAAVDANYGRDEVMTAACRSWANDPQLARRGSAVVCFCAAASLVVDEQTLRRSVVVKIDLGKDTERACVICQSVRNMNLPEEVLHANLGTLVNITAGLNLHQLQSILLESLARHGSVDHDSVASLKTRWIAREEIVEIISPRGGFEAVGGYEPVKEFIRNTIIGALSDPERAAYYGTNLPKGVLLFGPPGTGKTLFGMALAGATSLPFINLKTEDLFSRYLGDSGRLFSRAISIAEKNAPAIVFIDEIDRFGSRRSSTCDSAGEETRRVYNQILEWLGGSDRKTILVGTTNRPQDLDEALLREGRLDYKVPVLYPDYEARIHILKIHLGLTGWCRILPVSVPEIMDEMIRLMAERTVNFSGAELRELVQRIRRNAFLRGEKHARKGDFLQALNGFSVHQEERARQVEKYLTYARRFNNDKILFTGIP